MRVAVLGVKLSSFECDIRAPVATLYDEQIKTPIVLGVSYISPNHLKMQNSAD
ncbi:hypothetical protein GCM10007984_24200 [Shewanella putrefaciens]|nr:hypothetical protein GCM10007984_24200 [Shewanella putrefaciens]